MGGVSISPPEAHEGATVPRCHLFPCELSGCECGMPASDACVPL